MLFLALLATALAGYPLFFASFENLGPSEVGRGVQPFEEVDQQVTHWLTQCWAETFIVIKDMNPVDTTDLHSLKKFAQQSRTTGTFLTDYPIQMRELAEDVSIHCRAPLKDIDIYAETPTFQETNQRRTFYIEFDSSDRVPKSELIDKAMSKLTSPYVTIIYSSSFGADHPLFGSIEKDPKRDLWTKSYLEYIQGQQRVPIVAPIIDEKRRQEIRERRARRNEIEDLGEYRDYLPDDLFALLLMGGVLATVLVLLAKGVGALAPRPSTATTTESEPLRTATTTESEPPRTATTTESEPPRTATTTESEPPRARTARTARPL